ncbi:MAG: hypothetical protein E6559_22985, partial [Pantoea sp.]|nr:hypothetical protein [Pantoea sp.]
MAVSERNNMKNKFVRTAAGLLFISVVTATSLTATPAARAEAAHNMQGHDMSGMSGMDHSTMGNMEPMSGMEGMESMQPAAPDESRTPVPVLTDADRRAAFPDVHGHKVHDSNVNWYLLADQLEWQKNNE